MKPACPKAYIFFFFSAFLCTMLACLHNLKLVVLSQLLLNYHLQHFNISIHFSVEINTNEICKTY